MSSLIRVKLTKEQEEFLSFLEEEFKDRYTENDEEFKAVLNEEQPLPPIVENFRDFRRFDQRGGNDRNNFYHDRYSDQYSHNRYHYRHNQYFGRPSSYSSAHSMHSQTQRREPFP